MDRLELASGADVYVDFAHNPGALERTLRELNDLYSSVHLVFGCGGESDKGKRPEMGAIASELAERIYLTDDNPKSEDRLKIIRDIKAGLASESHVEVVPERKEAIELALEGLGAKTCLLVAGKGHERHQIVSGEWIEYNDMDYIRKLATEKSLL